MRKNIPFSCPTPHSREISHQRKKKERKLLPAAIPFLFWGEILHMPASGLGEMSIPVKGLNEIGPLNSALVLTLNVSACYEKLVQKATKHHACIIVVLEHNACMQVMVI
jgi:hypothetical protein